MALRTLAAVLLAWLVAGCGQRAPSVSDLQVVAGAHEDALRTAGLDPAALRDAVRGSMRDAGFRVVDGGGDYQARVEVLFAEEPSGGEPLEIEVELQLFGGKAGPMRALVQSGIGRARLPGQGDVAAWRAAFSAAVAEASAGLRRALAAEAHPTEKLLQDIEAADPRVREQAIRVLGDRRSREAVPGLIARLRDPELDVAERAAGALAQIGDPRAVGPIIDFTQRLDDGPYSPRYARIIGDIGGSEARGYLLTVESGHLDPRVRDAARAALEDLEAREREQAATVPPPPRSARRDSGRME